VGYPTNHSSDVFQFFNKETKRIILSRDAIWLNQTYSDYHGLNTVHVEDTTDGRTHTFDDEEDVDEYDIVELEDEEDMQLVGAIPQYAQIPIIAPIIPNVLTGRNIMTRSQAKRAHPVTRSGRHYGTVAATQSEEELETQMLSSAFGLIAGFDDGSNTPKTYKDIVNHPRKDEWWLSMKKEFESMTSKQVWDIVDISHVPSGRKIIGNRWVFSEKDDGRLRARTVAQGFSQIPGKDFYESHAPVVNDLTFRLTLAIKILKNLSSGQFDVETAFLYSDLDEENWMQFPAGYTEYLKETTNQVYDSSKYVLRLKKAIYGLVQAARQWWKKFKQAMSSANYFPSVADPCLFIKKQTPDSDISFVIIYVDDGGIIGTKTEIKRVLDSLANAFVVKSMGEMEYFVGCRIIEDKSQKTIWIHQPKLLTNLSKHFDDVVSQTRSTHTPAAPRTSIVRPTPGDPLITPEEQRRFRTGVGMLLYLVKHSRPDISNAVRELSKVADGATYSHWKALLRTIKYVLDTKNEALTISPRLQVTPKNPQGFYLEGISDSDYAGDSETRISVYGYILYFCGAPISWKSKAGKSVTLSSTEAEYYAVSEVAKEVLFAKHLLEATGIDIPYPIPIKCDNIGAIYLSNNHTTSQRTKHIDTRRHFVREFVEDGILKIVFVGTKDNEADIFTKNTSEETFMEHVPKLMGNINDSGKFNKASAHVTGIPLTTKYYAPNPRMKFNRVSKCLLNLDGVLSKNRIKQQIRKRAKDLRRQQYRLEKERNHRQGYEHVNGSLGDHLFKMIFES
jgi:hypothetical protein